MDQPLPHSGVGRAPHVKWGTGGSLRTGWGDHGHVSASGSSGPGRRQRPTMKWQPSPRLLLLPALVALVALVGLRLRHRPEEPVTAAPGPTPAAFQWQRVPLLPAGNTALAARHPLRPPYPHPYRFLLNQPHKCRERAPFLVLLVATAPEDTGSRDCIRRTWGNESSVPGVSIVRLFLLGVHPVFADALAPVLHEENQEYGDLIQQDFLDTYNNLTLKTLMGMEWVSKHCPNATYVMKADADVFLNLSYLTRRLLTPPKTGFATGYVYRGTGPIRSKASKWFVPYEVYPDATYPPYCAGPAYVLSADVAAGVYAAAQTLPLVPMEDAFVGICLHALGVAVTTGPWGAFSVGRIPYEPCRFARAVMVHRYPPREVLALWPRFQEAQGGCKGD